MRVFCLAFVEKNIFVFVSDAFISKGICDTIWHRFSRIRLVFNGLYLYILHRMRKTLFFQYTKIHKNFKKIYGEIAIIPFIAEFFSLQYA